MSDTLSAIVSRPRRVAGKPALFVGIVADAPRSPQARVSLAGIDRVEIARGEARKVERKTADGAQLVIVTLSDPRMSTKHARLTRLGTTWVVEDLGSKNGTWVGSQKVTRKPLIDGETMIVGHTALVFRDEGGEDADFAGTPPDVLPGLRTLSPSLATRYRELGSGARSKVPVQINGDIGTGKELVARAVHEVSGRTGKFIAVNCGALPGTLLEGELFGHAKGGPAHLAGANEQRPGLIRDADGGTLFLDEITELPASAQATLLRVLQEGNVIPIGGDQPVEVDVRFVTATHRDLDAEVTAGRFRADLRARLLGVAIELPPLRDRLEDLGLIVATLLDRLGPDRAITFSVDALGALYAHDWPLNIRELERSLAAALAVTHDRIEIAHLPASVGDTESIDDEEPLAPFGSQHRSGASPATPVAPAPQLSEADRVLREKLVAAISKHGGNLAAVAREMTKDRTQIRRWMKRFGLTRDNVE